MFLNIYICLKTAYIFRYIVYPQYRFPKTQQRSKEREKERGAERRNFGVVESGGRREAVDVEEVEENEEEDREDKEEEEGESCKLPGAPEAD
jgi:hypothetical protein